MTALASTLPASSPRSALLPVFHFAAAVSLNIPNLLSQNPGGMIRGILNCTRNSTWLAARKSRRLIADFTDCAQKKGWPGARWLSKFFSSRSKMGVDIANTGADMRATFFGAVTNLQLLRGLDHETLINVDSIGAGAAALSYGLMSVDYFLEQRRLKKFAKEHPGFDDTSYDDAAREAIVAYKGFGRRTHDILLNWTPGMLLGVRGLTLGVSGVEQLLNGSGNRFGAGLFIVGGLSLCAGACRKLYEENPAVRQAYSRLRNAVQTLWRKHDKATFPAPVTDLTLQPVY